MNVTLTDECYTLDGKWRLVPSEYMEGLTIPIPPQSLSSWQPMRTAPRDGTKIVVIGNNYGDRKQGTHICIALCIDGLFYEENDDIGMNVDSGFFLEHLTHWMPLPESAP